MARTLNSQSWHKWIDETHLKQITSGKFWTKKKVDIDMIYGNVLQYIGGSKRGINNAAHLFLLYRKLGARERTRTLSFSSFVWELCGSYWTCKVDHGTRILNVYAKPRNVISPYKKTSRWLEISMKFIVWECKNVTTLTALLNSNIAFWYANNVVFPVALNQLQTSKTSIVKMKLRQESYF